LKLNLDRIIETSLAVLLAAGVGAIGFLALQKYFGFFSYLGLSPQEVNTVASEVKRRYQLLSSVSCSNDHFCRRGVYLNPNSFPLYYRHEIFPDGNSDFHLYPMLTELWSSKKGVI
jgi:hypothetical protein